VIEKRLNQGSESSKLFCYFFEEFGNIEEIYSRSIAKLLKSTASMVEFGTLRDYWLSLRGELENLVKLHHDLGVTLHKELGRDLNKFKEDQSKMRKQYLSDASKLNKERKFLESNISKLRERYEEYAKKAEASHQKVEQAKSASKAQNEIAKLTASAQKYAKEEMLFENEYKDAITKLTTFQPTWEEKLASIYQELQVQEEDRIDYTKSILERYVAAVEVSAPYYSEMCKRLRDLTKTIDKNEDIECFIRENQTGNEKPSVPIFIPYKGSVSGTAYASSTPSFTTPTPTTSSTFTKTAPVSANSTTFSKSAPPNGKSKAGKTVKALYDYVGADANELDFFAGDSIQVLEEDGSGWWTGEIDGRKGLFPSNYVE